MWIGREPAFGCRNADLLEQFDRPPLCLFLVHAFMDPQRLHDLETDREARIEAGGRLLKDHRHVLAGELAPRSIRHCEQIAAAEQQTIGADAAGIGDKAHHREHRHGLA